MENNRSKLVKISWYAIMHYEDIENRPWIVIHLTDYQKKYPNSRAKVFWVLAECGHFKEPTYRIATRVPNVIGCYSCREEIENERR